MESIAPATFTGGCACGAVRCVSAAGPLAMVNCHCRDCQRAGGAGLSPTVVVARAAFALTGEPKCYEVASEAGNTATRAFCGHCGSPLFAWTGARPDVIGIRAGSLDDPSWFRPAVDFWVASKQPWDLLHPHTKKFAEGFVQEPEAAPLDSGVAP